jgi:hypothetical protein
MTIDSRLHRIVAAQLYPLLFATISGAHRTELQAAHDASKLPELPSDQTRVALNDLLVELRLQRKSLRTA